MPTWAQLGDRLAPTGTCIWVCMASMWRTTIRAARTVSRFEFSQSQDLASHKFGEWHD